MKSRLVSCLLILATIISSFSVVNAESNEISKNDRAFNTSVGLGIIDEGKEKSSNLTRAEFAHILCNLCGFFDEEDKEEDWFDGFFGDADENMSLVVNDGGVSEYYSDVDMSHEFYDEIKKTSSVRLLKGFGDGTFKPDANITNLEVSTTLINLLGYEKYASYYGGYPNGYPPFSCKQPQISVYRTPSGVHVGATNGRPRGRFFRIRIRFWRNRNILLRGRPLAAPTSAIASVR